jgi:hypothetical protein
VLPFPALEQGATVAHRLDGLQTAMALTPQPQRELLPPQLELIGVEIDRQQSGRPWFPRADRFQEGAALQTVEAWCGGAELELDFPRVSHHGGSCGGVKVTRPIRQTR